MNEIIGRSSSLLTDDDWRGEEVEGLNFGSPGGSRTGPPSPITPVGGGGCPGIEGVKSFPPVGVSSLFCRGRNSQRWRGKSSTKSLGLSVSCDIRRDDSDFHFHYNNRILAFTFIMTPSVAGNSRKLV